MLTDNTRKCFCDPADCAIIASHRNGRDFDARLFPWRANSPTNLPYLLVIGGKTYLSRLPGLAHSQKSVSVGIVGWYRYSVSFDSDKDFPIDYHKADRCFKY